MKTLEQKLEKRLERVEEVMTAEEIDGVISSVEDKIKDNGELFFSIYDKEVIEFVIEEFDDFFNDYYHNKEECLFNLLDGWVEDDDINEIINETSIQLIEDIRWIYDIESIFYIEGDYIINNMLERELRFIYRKYEKLLMLEYFEKYIENEREKEIEYLTELRKRES